MFGISWNEYILIAIVALIVIGPKELPGVLRSVGQWTAKIRRMAAEFQGQFHEAMREAEMGDLKKEVDDLAAQARGLTSQFSDPLNFQDAAKQEATKWEYKPDAALPASPEDPNAAANAADAPAVPSLTAAEAVGGESGASGNGTGVAPAAGPAEHAVTAAAAGAVPVSTASEPAAPETGAVKG
jgi:sec-independent protein translocase protein TatB